MMPETDLVVAVVIGAAVALVFCLALLVPRNVRPPRSTETKLDDVMRRLNDVEERAKSTEHDLRGVRMVVGGLATKESVNLLAVEVAKMSGEVRGVVANTAATTRSIERIEDFLMKSAAEAISGAKHTSNGS